MALWQIGNRPASKASDFSGSSSESMPFRIIYPNADGSTGGSKPNYTDPGSISSDVYGGTPITINTGNSAEGMNSLSYAIGNGFDGLMNLIQQNTDKNNAWSAEQAQRQMNFQERMNQIAMDFNSSEAAKNRDWQMMMSNTAHQREIADLKAAGLNPILSASGGNGAAVTSGATASGVTSAGAKGDTDQSANAALTSLYGALINSQTQMYNANLSAKTNLAIADKQMQASMYGAQLAAETARSSNPYQILTSIVDQLAGNGNRGSGYGNLVNASPSIISQADEVSRNLGPKVKEYLKTHSFSDLGKDIKNLFTKR